jgi:hypothetical protein
MTMPGFTAEAALVAKEGHYGQVQTTFTASPRETVSPQLEHCGPCWHGVHVCCSPWECYVDICGPG